MKSGSRILVIDDEAQIRSFLEVTITSEDYLFFGAKTGGEGLTQAVAIRPDLIILDLGLPDLTGLSVLQQIRKWSPVPVIILTVKDAEEEKVALLDAGADDFLTKPFSVPELLARIRTALRHGAQGKDLEHFKSGNLEVNLEAHIVKVKGTEVKLTITEFDLLKVLVKNAGKVVTQRQLLKEVWGPNSIEHSHYLRIYVALLRKKIESNPSVPELLITEPGVGYRLRMLSS